MFEQAPEGVYGVCNVCKTVVMTADIHTHPCPDYYVDYSWAALTNPHNEAWKPGYRFTLQQDSQKVGRTMGRMKTRVYTIHFEIDANGEAKVRRSTSTQPTEATMARANALVAEKMPKLFLTPEQLQHIVDSWEGANNPISIEIAEKAKAILEK